MARLCRPPYTKPMPPGAEIITQRGRSHARFKDDDGRIVTAPLTRKGDRIRLLSSKWYGEYRDGDGVLRCEALSTNRTAAEQMLAERVKKVELRKANVFDPFEEHRNRPLAEHLEDYRRYLKAEGNCEEYVAKTCARIRVIVDGCQFVFIPDYAPKR